MGTLMQSQKPLGLKRSEICHSMAECGLSRLVSADSMSPTIYVAYSWHRKSCNASMAVAIATAIHGNQRGWPIICNKNVMALPQTYRR